MSFGVGRVLANCTWHSSDDVVFDHHTRTRRRRSSMKTGSRGRRVWSSSARRATLGTRLERDRDGSRGVSSKTSGSGANDRFIMGCHPDELRPREAFTLVSASSAPRDSAAPLAPGSLAEQDCLRRIAGPAAFAQGPRGRVEIELRPAGACLPAVMGATSGLQRSPRHLLVRACTLTSLKEASAYLTS